MSVKRDETEALKLRSRRPRKAPEAAFFDYATSRSWQITSRGWPDYCVIRDGRLVAVEIVSEHGRRPRHDKRVVMALLTAQGIDCYVWSPDGGFEPFRGFGGSSVGATPDATRQSTTATKDGTAHSPPIVPPSPRLFDPGPAEAADGDPDSEGEDPGDAVSDGESIDSQIDRVWAHYVETMQPRHKLAGEEERRIIRAALKVASVDECCGAISGCAGSAFHMGKNDRGRKYNKLSQILRGRQGKETTRERIDYFLDLRDKQLEAGQFLPSVDPAVMSEKKRLVQRGWRFPDSREHVRNAETAEAWLKERGIETVRREPDGYPIFRPLRRGQES